MAHRYESIKELDEEMNGEKRKIGMEMTIEKYMEPQPFRKLGRWGEEEIEETTIGYVCSERKSIPQSSWEEYEKREVEERCKEEERCVSECPGHYPRNLANRSNRVMVKNVYTGVLFEFTTMLNSARFMGATYNNMRYGIIDKEARVFSVGQDKFVFEYDGVERRNAYNVVGRVLYGFVEVVWSSGLRERFDSYLSVAIHLGLLIGHIMEEEDRCEELARRYVIGKKCCTLEFNGERRENDYGKGIVSHWMGLYEGDWRKVRKVVITQGNPQPV